MIKIMRSAEDVSTMFKSFGLDDPIISEERDLKKKLYKQINNRKLKERSSSNNKG